MTVIDKECPVSFIEFYLDPVRKRVLSVVFLGLLFVSWDRVLCSLRWLPTCSVARLMLDPCSSSTACVLGSQAAGGPGLEPFFPVVLTCIEQYQAPASVYSFYVMQTNWKDPVQKEHYSSQMTVFLFNKDANILPYLTTVKLFNNFTTTTLCTTHATYWPFSLCVYFSSECSNICGIEYIFITWLYLQYYIK